MKRDDQARTPPHGDALRRAAWAASTEALTSSKIEGLPQPRRLPSHVERAARKAWRAGYEAAEYDRRHPSEPKHNDDAGLDAFLCSIQADAEEAVRAAEERTAAAAPHEIDLMQALTDSLKERTDG